MGEPDGGDSADDESGQGDSGQGDSGQGGEGQEGSGGGEPERGDSGASDFAHGPNTVCLICGGFRKLSEPRIYVMQATSDTTAGMTMGEWRDCPHCGGSGLLRGLRTPA